MSMIHPNSDRHNNVNRNNDCESMTSREQILGMLVLILVILLAILLRSQ